jgi:hypothetical protein
MRMEALGGPIFTAGQEAGGVNKVLAKSVECNDGNNSPTMTR